MAKTWEIGEGCLVMGWRGWPSCYGVITGIVRLPQDPPEKYYGGRNLTPVIDWSQFVRPDGYVWFPTRETGDEFNVHYSDLRPCEPPPEVP